ncbi:DUF72 domain-containing protein [Chitinophaga qingshengii]|uniref:DUF72 domain-containing protein n=1 Tax=Chitinophaga qingshengii TaxID=1569794 RepID=A0ABR7TS05_9BACT|nr:DUF72 domain-containing protein [Chitinophaga qingshengii]
MERNSLPSDTAYAAKIKKWHAAQHAVWAFFNNDGHGYALKNAVELKTLLEV